VSRRSEPATRPLVSAALAAAVTAGGLAFLDAGTGPSWRRRNYRGVEVTLSAGPAVAAGLLVGVGGRRELTGATVAVAGAALAGFYDDCRSVRDDERVVKGFAGHLRALAAGRASAGAVKVVVIGLSSLAGAFLRSGASVETALDGCLVAGSANLCNLLDLRPGRALKVATAVTVAAAPFSHGVSRTMLGASYGTLAVVLPVDLGERSMLGDTGANALGALVGSVLCTGSRRSRVLALSVVAGLTALSEKVSFSRVIATNPTLRWLDELGRAGG
jgi:UDP-N-acetylmuramyl pentapeptide phosphotransferase/UDP-N-acetylglucosamine-1-phosphate transferase